MPFLKEDIKFFLRRLRDNINSLYLDGYCYFAKFLNRYTVNKHKIFIDRLYFEVTNVCNLRCRYCVYSKRVPEKFGTMEFGIFKKAINEFNELGGRIVIFTPTIGEPLLDSNLISKIEYALQLPSIKKAYFYTNGTLLFKNENYKKLIDTRINAIEVSLAACDRDIFKKISQVDLYEQTIKGIHKLLEYNASKGNKTEIFINFRSPVLPSEVLKSEDFQKHIKPFSGPKIKYTFLSDYDNWCGNIKPDDLLGVMRLRRISKFKYLPCIRTYDAAILFDGSVRLCACRVKNNEFDELVVGNIKNNSLKEIFYSEKADEVRKSFLKKKTLPACENCSLYMPATKKFLLERKKISTP